MSSKEIDQFSHDIGFRNGYQRGFALGKSMEREKEVKFYYCESNNKHYIGRRCDTRYYAEVMVYPSGEVCLSYGMSRYLPWGEDNYPSEPKEISVEDFLEWFLKEFRITKTNQTLEIKKKGLDGFRNDVVILDEMHEWKG